MADNKKYYYLKLKDNFFDTDEMIVLQNMQDGYLYSDILMKLYLRSLKNEGKLMFKDVIPYTPEVLAQVVRHHVGVVKQALDIFKTLGLVEIFDSGAIYMLDIQNFIGKSSTEADRVRLYDKRMKKEKEQLKLANVEIYEKSTPELEKELKLDLEIKKDIEINKEKTSLVEKQTKAINPIYINMANYMFSKILELHPNNKKPNINKWADDFRKLVELDNRDVNEVGNLINWVYQDNFWKAVILSPKKLREKYDQLVIRANRNIMTQESFENKINRMAKEAMEMEMDF